MSMKRWDIIRDDHSRSALAALASAIVVATGFAALVLGLDLRQPPPGPRLALVAILPAREVVPPPPPPPPPPMPRPKHDAANRAPASEGRKAPPLAIPLPPLVLASPLPVSMAGTGTGDAGSGTGAGGNGNGTGGGGNGGSGGNLNSGVATLPRQTAGRMLYSDLPEDLRKARAGGELTVRYRIGTDGLVSGCTVLTSSGRPDLDAATCDHITRRFRFRPARDASGQAVPFVMTETHGWDNSAGTE
ncbi:protein TonB [Novosphingobium sp. PhB165]|uniref:energy transducer TonB n=1 Tax=Novosphingobium sp. PhB165 TaxID=2485105 RepID=UPI0010D40556|nr:energy transducer TonB [Novosphingobium sp. PhB165]TCM18094.1 protein TonB [Novosphingobium sp. PhB165]